MSESGTNPHEEKIERVAKSRGLKPKDVVRGDLQLKHGLDDLEEAIENLPETEIEVETDPTFPRIRRVSTKKPPRE